jgi:hypothetical protein
MALKFWTNQTVRMQSAIGAAIAITGISKASPGVVSTAGAVPANGAYVLLEVAGMTQVNNRVFKVGGSGSGVFNIGVDTTQFGTFTGGTFRVLTLGLSFNSMRDISSSGGDPVFEDTTTIHDPEDTQAIISSSPQSFSATADWDPQDATLIAANTAFILRQPRAFSFQDPDGSEYLFYAYVNAPLNPTVSGKKKVTPLSLALRASGTSVA